MKRLTGEIHDEVTVMGEPDFSIEYAENEAEAEIEDSMQSGRNRFDSTEAFDEAMENNTALEVENTMLKAMLAKEGAGRAEKIFKGYNHDKSHNESLHTEEDNHHVNETRALILQLIKYFKTPNF